MLKLVTYSMYVLLINFESFKMTNQNQEEIFKHIYKAFHEWKSYITDHKLSPDPYLLLLRSSFPFLHATI